ncbi:hypothetical protein MUP32_05640, partial [Candidatus Microgenomates bacterium]|nr:hypothetical protein [Candidatus Microgenomates bacterium]
KTFVSLKNNLLNVGQQYKWNDRDQAYYDYKDYQTDDRKNYEIYYPFRSLFTKRRTDEKEFQLEDTYDWIIFKNQIPKNSKGTSLKIGKYKDLEKLMPVEIEIRRSIINTYEVYIKYLLPQIYLDGQMILDTPDQIKLGEFHMSDLQGIRINVNNNEIDVKDDLIQSKSFFSFDIDNKIQVFDKDNILLFSWRSNNDNTYVSISDTELSLPIEQISSGLLEIRVPKVTDNNISGIDTFSDLDKFLPKPCNEYIPSNKNKFDIRKENGLEYIRLISKNSRQCISLNFDQLPTSLSFLIEVQTRKVQGNNPVLYISNNRQVHYLDTYIYNKEYFDKYYFILPPSFKNEMGYDIYFDNYSRTDNETINDFGGIALWVVPYKFLTDLKIEQSIVREKSVITNEELIVIHPNPSYYKIQITDNQSAPAGKEQITDDITLVLSQSYDKAWKAYQINSKYQVSSIKYFLESNLPFIFGKEIKEHVLVNNWKNGWKLTDNKNTTIILFYLPQLLEYLGFALLGITVIFSLLSVGEG